MSAVATPPVPFTRTPPAAPVPWTTAAELLHALGDVPAERVWTYPYPGTATEADAIAAHRAGYLCELLNGTLVEKPMGVPESYLGVIFIHYLTAYAFVSDTGLVLMADSQFRMLHGNLRLPDVSFTRRERLPNPLPQVGGWSPDLCVEVLSPSNTRGEMAQKRQEYFANGTRLVWEADPDGRWVDVYTDPTAMTRIDETGTLDGGPVLPGFTLSIGDLFARFDVYHQRPQTP